MSQTDIHRQLADNLARVRATIAEAAHRSGRSPDDVTLVAITKYVDAATARELFECGCRHIGESRPQGLWQKAEALQSLPIEWHLVGHLQRNKVRRTLQYAHVIQSVDSVPLARAINVAAESQSRTVDILLEVNVSGEAAKHGFTPQSLRETFATLAEHPHLNIRGLMCMAGLGVALEEIRRQFAQLRDLRDELLTQARQSDQFVELSMGMSGDYETAIEEGATMVRLGTVLFEGLL